MAYPEAADPKESAGAPDEIEVTPEMIEAGCREYATISPREDDYEEIVRSIYEAMEACRLGLRKRQFAVLRR
jgi:hypothetical protein